MYLSRTTFIIILLHYTNINSQPLPNLLKSCSLTSCISQFLTSLNNSRDKYIGSLSALPQETSHNLPVATSLRKVFTFAGRVKMCRSRVCSAGRRDTKTQLLLFPPHLLSTPARLDVVACLIYCLTSVPAAAACVPRGKPMKHDSC